MRPVTQTLTGAGDHVIPLCHYAETGVSYHASVAVVVKPLVNKADTTTVIETIASATSGNFSYPADALLVTTTANTVINVLQYGT